MKFEFDQFIHQLGHRIALDHTCVIEGSLEELLEVEDWIKAEIFLEEQKDRNYSIERKRRFDDASRVVRAEIARRLVV